MRSLLSVVVMVGLVGGAGSVKATSPACQKAHRTIAEIYLEVLSIRKMAGDARILLYKRLRKAAREPDVTDQVLFYTKGLIDFEKKDLKSLQKRRKSIDPLLKLCPIKKPKILN